MTDAGDFWRSVRALAQSPSPAFHMPGHGQRPLDGAEGPFPAQVYALDQSEMAGVDYLHEPIGALARAQDRAAQVFGADRSWFLVNGATVANHAALWAVAAPGGRVLALRRSHQSVHTGLALAGLEPLYLRPVADERHDGLFGVDLAEVRLALACEPDLVAVHVTSPDYYGFRLPLTELAELAHEAGLPLIVDEAHGAHLGLLAGEGGALQAGADLVVHSPHKALGSLTQSALLHQRGARVDVRRVSEALTMLQSSSPSTLLTMSLEAVVDELGARGALVWHRQVALARRVQAACGWDGQPLLSARDPLPVGVCSADPCKLLLDSVRYRRSVVELRAGLAAAGIVPEFADHRHVVLSVTRGTSEADVELLLAVLEGLVRTAPDVARTPVSAVRGWPTAPPERRLDARAAMQSPSHVLPLHRAAGEVVAAPLTPYPPGVPLVLPGEVIDEALVAVARRLLGEGLVVRGLLPAADGAPGVRCVVPPLLAPHARTSSSTSRTGERP